MLRNVYTFNTVETEWYRWEALLDDEEKKKFEK